MSEKKEPTYDEKRDFVEKIAQAEFGQLHLRQLIDLALEYLTDEKQLKLATDFCLAAERDCRNKK